MYSFARSTAAGVALGAHVREELGRTAATALGGRHRAAQAPADLGDGRRRLLVRALELPLAEHVRQHRDLVSKVIEGQQQIGDHERQLGQPGVVIVGLADRGLRRAYEVVAEQSDRATGERRQSRERRNPIARQLLRHERVGVGVLAAAEPHHRPRLESEERPAPHALALLRRLEQERRPAAAQLEIGRHGGLAIGDEGVPQRHEGVIARKLADLVQAGAELECRDVVVDDR